MPVMGHVPAFSNANDMINAGYDELTHINQTMLGWVLEPGEDTRTLLQLTALQRLPNLDLNSPPVQKTLDLMAQHKVAMDPTDLYKVCGAWRSAVLEALRPLPYF